MRNWFKVFVEEVEISFVVVKYDEGFFCFFIDVFDRDFIEGVVLIGELNESLFLDMIVVRISGSFGCGFRWELGKGIGSVFEVGYVRKNGGFGVRRCYVGLLEEMLVCDRKIEWIIDFEFIYC